MNLHDEEGRDLKLADLNEADFEHDMGVAVAYAKTGYSLGESRMALAVVVTKALPVVADAVLARFALGQRRSVKVRGLAALTGLSQTRIRQCNLVRDADGDVEYSAAEHFLQGRRIQGFVQRSFDVTPTWWRQLQWNDPRRGKAEKILGEALQGLQPSVMFSLGASTVELSFTLQTDDPMSDERAKELQKRIQGQIEKIQG